MRSVAIPSREDIDTAGNVVREYLRPTPLVKSPALEEAYLKLESLQATGSFKVRGALAAVSRLDPDRGVVTSSAGNHGLGVAFAAHVLGRKATVVVPERASKAKVRALDAFPARVVLHGSTYDEAEGYAMKLATDGDLAYVSPYNDPWVIAGQGTIGLEFDLQAHEATTIVCPIGGGGLCSGIVLWASTRPNTTVIGVDCESSPAMRAALDAGQIVEVPVRSTIADGLSGNLEAGSITYTLVREYIDDVVVVSEREIEDAMGFLAVRQGLVAEGAGATATAAVIAGRVEGRGRTIILVTGRNVAPDVLARILANSQ